MVAKKRTEEIEDLLLEEAWGEARALIERERTKEPTNHWLMTQLGVTFYEEGDYAQALSLFMASRDILPDCPLTQWNLAGVLDALGRHGDAVRIYTWLLQSEIAATDDPCWESEPWTEALKADCVYRLGSCFQQLGKKQKAEQCYRQYLNLLALGIEGLYSMEEVRHQLHVLGNGRSKRTQSGFRKAVQATLEVSGIAPRKHRRQPPPTIDFATPVSAPTR